MAAVGTWLRIILILIGLGVMGMCAVAGAGIYFVSQHVSTAKVSASNALDQFTKTRERFKDVKPLIDIDRTDHARVVRATGDMPTAAAPASMLVVMAWDPSDERIVNFRIPLWVLSMGERKVDLGVGNETFDLGQLDLDVKELIRVGATLLLDLTSPNGEHVLIWTE
jgi:hypothetical protein